VNAAFGLVGLFGFVALACLVFRDLGFKQGHQQGWKECENWWLGIERDADRERLKMWREYERKGWP
jgi:hypothetical protein